MYMEELASYLKAQSGNSAETGGPANVPVDGDITDIVAPQVTGETLG